MVAVSFNSSRHPVMVPIPFLEDFLLHVDSQKVS